MKPTKPKDDLLAEIEAEWQTARKAYDEEMGRTLGLWLLLVIIVCLMVGLLLWRLT